MRLKRVISALCLSVVICAPVLATTETIVVNGVDVVVETESYMNSKLISLRKVSDALGLVTKYDSKTRTIEVSSKSGRRSLKMVVGDTKAEWTSIGDTWLNNDYSKTITMTLAPMIINETTYVPLRFVADTFNCIVSYKENTVYVTEKIRFPMSSPPHTLFETKNGKVYRILSGYFVYDEDGVYSTYINDIIALENDGFEIKDEELPGGVNGTLTITLPIDRSIPRSEFHEDWSGYSKTKVVYDDMSNINSGGDRIMTFTNPKNGRSITTSSKSTVRDSLKLKSLDNLIKELGLDLEYSFDRETGILKIIQK